MRLPLDVGRSVFHGDCLRVQKISHRRDLKHAQNSRSHYFWWCSSFKGSWPFIFLMKVCDISPKIWHFHAGEVATQSNFTKTTQSVNPLPTVFDNACKKASVAEEDLCERKAPISCSNSQSKLHPCRESRSQVLSNCGACLQHSLMMASSWIEGGHFADLKNI